MTRPAAWSRRSDAAETPGFRSVRNNPSISKETDSKTRGGEEDGLARTSSRKGET